MQKLHEAMLKAPLDVEDLGKLGKKWSCCPYYAARQTQSHADVVFMPYSALLSSDAREVRPMTDRHTDRQTDRKTWRQTE